MSITTKEIIKEELEQLKKDIIQRQKDSGAMASGKTAAGYEVVAEGELHGQLKGYSYVGVLEVGRKPGKVPMYFKEIIKRWIISKGLQYQDDKDLNRMAASIAWVIHKEGTTLHRNGYKVDIFDTPLKDFTNRINEKISMFYHAQAINEIYAPWQQ